MRADKISAIFVFICAIFALGLALFSQYAQGFHPCELCIYQRVAFAVAAVFALSFLLARKRQFLWLAILGLLANSAIAGLHIGVEQSWWQWASACSSVLDVSSIEALRAQILAAPAVRCDEPTWFLLGLSMASWSFAYSSGAALVAIVLTVFKKRNFSL